MNRESTDEFRDGWMGMQRRFSALNFFSATLLALAVSYHANAQEDSDIPMESEPPAAAESKEVDVIEAEIGKSPAPEPIPEAQPRSSEREETGLAELKNLSPFSSVSVIQRKFLPKTKRFQIFAGGSVMMNDPWFNSLGFNLKGAFHLTEQWGLELSYLGLSKSDRDSVRDLRNNNGVGTASLLTTKSFMGADIMWYPIYGKTSLFGQKIVPFDMYFSGGVGESSVTGGTGGMTIHIGTGQIYAISKGLGFRWDFSVNNFSGKSDSDGSTSTFNNVLLSLGVSMFFPEAGYR